MYCERLTCSGSAKCRNNLCVASANGHLQRGITTLIFLIDELLISCLQQVVDAINMAALSGKHQGRITTVIRKHSICLALEERRDHLRLALGSCSKQRCLTCFILCVDGLQI